jgi:hypothetical protein
MPMKTTTQSLNKHVLRLYNGRLDILKYAHENSYMGQRNKQGSCFISGDAEKLKYAHESGCPWDEWVFTYAARKGNLEMLELCT